MYVDKFARECVSACIRCFALFVEEQGSGLIELKCFAQSASSIFLTFLAAQVATFSASSSTFFNVSLGYCACQKISAIEDQGIISPFFRNIKCSSLNLFLIGPGRAFHSLVLKA